MKKISILFLALLLLIGSVLPAAALTESDFTDIAGHIPAGATLVMTLRADAGFFETVDGLLADILVETGIMPADANLLASSDRSAGYVQDGETFDSLYRDWLGDTATVFVLTGEIVEGVADYSDINVNLYSVTDREAATVYLTKLIDDNDYDTTELSEWTLYTPSDAAWRDSYLLGDDYLYEIDGLAEDAAGAFVEILTGANMLADDEAYTTALAGLPEDDYNLMMYLNVLDTIPEDAVTQADGALAFLGLGDMFGAATMRDALGSQIIGLTLLDGQALTVDFVQVVNDLEGLPHITHGQLEKDPVNMDFAANIPADAVVMMHDSGLGHAVEDSFALIDMLGDALDRRFESEVRDMNDERVGLLLIDDAATFLKLTYKGLTGQTLEEGIGWMNGNYAVYGRVVEYANDGIGVDGGIIIENTDADAAEAFIEGQRNALADLYLTYRESDNMIAVDWLAKLARRMFPESENFARNIDLVIGWNDELLVGGARPGVETVLSGDDAGITSTDAFQAATAYLLDDPQSVAYINFAEFLPMADYLERVTEGDYPPEIAAVIEKFSSASMSTTYNEESGVLQVRMVLSLAE